MEAIGPSYRRWGILACAAAALLIAIPSAACAVVATAAPALVLGPMKVKAYTVTVFVTSTGDATSLGISFARSSRDGTSAQSHSYAFVLPQSAFTWSADRSRARLDTAAALGAFGKIGPAVFSASGRAASVRAPVPCRGSLRGRPGRLRGSFRFVADGGRYFGAVRTQSLPATLADSAAGLVCGATQPPRADLTLLAESSGRRPLGTFVVTKARGRVTETMQVLENRAPASVVHAITVNTGQPAFTSVARRRTATVRGAVGKPFLTGSLGFRPVKSGSSSGGCQETIGRLSGRLTAHFDSIGARHVRAGSRATLSSCS